MFHDVTQGITEPRGVMRIRGAAAMLGLFVALGLALPAASAAATPGAWITPADEISSPGTDGKKPRLAVTSAGSTIAVWESAGAGVVSEMRAAVRPPGGTFGDPIELSAAGETAWGPQIVTTPDGAVVVIWRNDDLEIRAAIGDSEGSFAAPVTLSGPGTTSMNPHVATGADGRAIVTWEGYNGTNYEIQYAARPAGGTFGPAAVAANLGRNATDPWAAVAPDGTEMIVWGQYEAPGVSVRALTRPDGGTFSSVVAISPALAPGVSFKSPRAMFAPDGSSRVTFERRSPTNEYRLMTVERSAEGSFGTAKDVSSDSPALPWSELAVAADGTAATVWLADQSGRGVVQAALAAPGEDFGSPTNLSAPGDLSDPGPPPEQPRVALAPDGTATAVWARQGSGARIVQTATRPPGGRFGTPADLSVAERSAELPDIVYAPDGTGIATAVWSRYDGSDWRIQAASTAAPQLLLAVSRSGEGSGTVKDDAGRIECGTGCATTLPAYTRVTLTATPAASSRFDGWSGDCTGSSTTCTVRLDRARNATATFVSKRLDPRPPPGSAVFDGRKLHVRLKCPARFKPRCVSNAVPVTKKGRKGRPMAKPIRKKVRSGKWKVTVFRIKPKFRSTVNAMSRKSGKTLFVRQRVRSKKLGKKKFRGKARTVFHRYIVRRSG